MRIVKQSKKRVFYSMLFSYLGITFALLFLLLFLSGLFLQSYTEELYRRKSDSLTTIRNNLDMNTANLNTTVYLANQNKAFSSTYLRENYAQFYNVCKELSQICHSDNFLYSTHYVNNTLDLIYSPETQYTFPKFALYGGSFDDRSPEDMVCWLQSQSTDCWYPATRIRDSSTSAITYVKMLKTYRTEEKDFLMFQIATDTIDAITGIHADDPNECFAIFDTSGQLLYASDPGFAFEPETLALKTGADRVRIGDTILFASRSNVSTLRFYNAVSAKYLLEPVHKMYVIIILSVSVMLVFSLIMIMNSMRRNYRPIQSVSQIASQHLNHIAPDERNLDEIETTFLALQTIAKDNQAVNRQNSELKSQKQSAEDARFLSALLLGAFSDERSLAASLQKSSLSLSGPSYAVLLIELMPDSDKTLFSFDHGIVINYLASTLGGDLRLNILDSVDYDGFFVLAEGSNGALDALLERLDEAARGLSSILMTDCRIGVSGRFEQLLHAGDFRRQAEKAVHSVTAEQAVCCFDDLVIPEEDDSPDLGEWLRRLEEALLRGDVRLTDEICALLMPAIECLNHSAEAMFTAQEILTTGRRVLRRLQYPQSLLYQMLPISGSELRFQAAKDLLRILHDLAVEIQLRLESTTATQNQRMQRILQYIESHYTDPSFSTKVLADEMGMSVSNLSHYFKKQSGHVISEHISNLRFTKAKLLLCTTNLPLNSIIQQSGYYHVATLIRQFKQIEGMTPTEYRNTLAGAEMAVSPEKKSR